jgi:copper chaperone CopZ
MTTASYAVAGLTCEHCAQAVRQEVGKLAGVVDVSVTLAPGGVSTLDVTSSRTPSAEQVAAALDEAGDYRLS